MTVATSTRYCAHFVVKMYWQMFSVPLHVEKLRSNHLEECLMRKKRQLHNKITNQVYIQATFNGTYCNIYSNFTPLSRIHPLIHHYSPFLRSSSIIKHMYPLSQSSSLKSSSIIKHDQTGIPFNSSLLKSSSTICHPSSSVSPFLLQLNQPTNQQSNFKCFS